MTGNTITHNGQSHFPQPRLHHIAPDPDGWRAMRRYTRVYEETLPLNYYGYGRGMLLACKSDMMEHFCRHRQNPFSFLYSHTVYLRAIWTILTVTIIILGRDGYHVMAPVDRCSLYTREYRQKTTRKNPIIITSPHSYYTNYPRLTNRPPSTNPSIYLL